MTDVIEAELLLQYLQISILNLLFKFEMEIFFIKIVVKWVITKMSFSLQISPTAATFTPFRLPKKYYGGYIQDSWFEMADIS